MAKIERPAQAPEVAVHADEFAGHGGSYIIDPATGKRRLVARTGSPAGANAAPQAAQPAEPKTEE